MLKSSQLLRVLLVALVVTSLTGCLTQTSTTRPQSGGSGSSVPSGGATLPMPGESGSPGTGADAGAQSGDRGESTDEESAAGAGPESDEGDDASGAGGEGGTGESTDEGTGSSGEATTPAPSAQEPGSAGQGPQVPAPPAEDRRAAIDRRLQETFGTFDAAVRSAQEAVARERAEQEAATGGTPAGAAGVEEDEAEAGTADARARGGLESVGASGEAGDGDEAGEGGGQGGGGGAGGTGSSGPNEIPADVPDGRDDDIVARQIREAAMKEKDPELRAALWEEYRRYKRGG